MARRRAAAVISVGAATLSFALALSPLGASAALRPHLTSLNAPSAMVAVGQQLWIANRASSNLVVFDTSTKTFVKTVTSATLGVGRPDSIVRVSTHFFVASHGGPISELTLAGHHVRTIRPTGCGGGDTWLFSYQTRLLELCATGSLNVINPGTGQLTRHIDTTATQFVTATAATIASGRLFVTRVTPGNTSDGVVVMNLANYAVLTVLTNSTNALYAFTSPHGIASDGTHLWISNQTTQAVTEISLAAPYSFIQVVDSGYGFYLPTIVLTAVVASPPSTAIYVASNDGPQWSMVTRFTSSTSAPLTYGWMMCNSNDHYQFNAPSALVITRGSLWVINAGDSILDQMDVVGGTLTATFS